MSDLEALVLLVRGMGTHLDGTHEKKHALAVASRLQRPNYVVDGVLQAGTRQQHTVVKYRKRAKRAQNKNLRENNEISFSPFEFCSFFFSFFFFPLTFVPFHSSLCVAKPPEIVVEQTSRPGTLDAGAGYKEEEGFGLRHQPGADGTG